MLTLIFGIRASESPWAWRTTEKAGPDRVKTTLGKLKLLMCTMSDIVAVGVNLE